MNLGVFEDDGYARLLPLTWLRPACELLVGQDRLLDKLIAQTGLRPARMWTREALEPVVAERHALAAPEPGADWWLFNSRALATGPLTPPPTGTAWIVDDELVAVALADDAAQTLTSATLLEPAARSAWLADMQIAPPPPGLRLLRYPWDFVGANEGELRRQFLGGGQVLGDVHPGAHLVAPESIHVAVGAVVKPGVVLDASDGPITLAAGATVQPNAVLEGPCYIGPGSIVRPGSAIREATTLGPVCKIGGEVEASVILGYSNKQHDGFLGHSYVANWVNLGADTVTSDLKNTYGTIRVSLNGVAVESGQRFVGATIGDHAKTGIGTILPTGCVIGAAANVFCSHAAPKFVPSFGWLTDDGLQAAKADKIVQIAEAVMARREKTLSAAERALLAHVAVAARAAEAAGWAS